MWETSLCAGGLGRVMVPAGTDGRSVAPLTVAVAVAVVVVDQLTKWWAARTLDDHDIDVFWTLRFHLSHNTGDGVRPPPHSGVR